ncbi:hypothetical protein BpHYR1_043876 [Brachionus plicatilis]|uniref:Uncharacterized protein n=1 Tax=Brachionus plicatilis TaxID=10195 RepID=A0A3M7T7J1_BRAPC|nr:hypothetical protein BpHYR1_043876 [Brachionus plicatilis]
MSCSNQNYNQNTDHQQKQKRFIEKFKSKLIELFFVSNKKIAKQNDTNKNRDISNCTTTATTVTTTFSPSSIMNFKDNSISNYYYGYITTNVAVSNNSNRKGIKTNNKSQSNSAENISQYSIENSSKCSSVSEDYTEPVHNDKTKNNPFFDASLSELLTFDNLINFNRIKNHFDPFLFTIEDENNFFDVDFMTNYISFYIMDNLCKSSFLAENNLNLVTNESSQINQVKQIAREIFLQSECEPCGLKGCAIRIFIESETDEFTQKLCDFRFDTNSYLTTFQLDLTIGCHYYPAHVKSKMNYCDQTNQSDNTLAKSLRSLISFKSSNCDSCPRTSSICLRSLYSLKKIKLY